jgi:hypothetical protein
MVRSSVLILGLAISWMPCGFAHAADEDASFRYKWPLSSTLHYQVEQSMKMDMDLGGQEIKITVKQTFDMHWSVEGIKEDGSGIVLQRMTNLHMELEGPTGKAIIDARDKTEPEDPVARKVWPMLRLLEGSEVSMTIDRRGQVSNIKMSDKMVKAIKEMPDDLKSLGDMFSEDGMKKLMSQASMVLPEKPLTKGDMWSNTIETKSGPIKVRVTNRYTFDGPTMLGNRKLDKITWKPTTTFQMEDNAPFEMKIKSQEGEGTVYFDRGAGRLVETTMTQTMELESGQMFTQKIQTGVKMKLVDPKQ